MSDTTKEVTPGCTVPFVIVAGTSMWIQMNSTDGLSHAIVNVECVDDSADISRAETVSSTLEFTIMSVSTL